MKQFLHRYALYFAWVIALAGLCLSIFFGEILHNEPCPLCWYQRIALFPLALWLGIAAYRSDAKIVSYAFPLAAFGMIAAFVQIFEGYFPALQRTGICSFGETCTQPAFILFGIIDFPLLSAVGFILIIVCLFFTRQIGKEGQRVSTK